LSRPPPKFTIEFRHSWHSQTFRSIGKINRKINQTGKFEAVFKSTYWPVK